MCSNVCLRFYSGIMDFYLSIDRADIKSSFTAVKGQTCLRLRCDATHVSQPQSYHIMGVAPLEARW